jgi:hypothetical protein
MGRLFNSLSQLSKELPLPSTVQEDGGMSQSMLRHLTTPLYHRLFAHEILDFELRETKATCHACAMAPKEYRADLKCCTFEPFLPNYLVGAALQSASTFASTLEVLREKIKERRLALPIGVAAPLRFQIEFNHRERGDFGNREEWLCPYYSKETQNCGIWKHRGAVCTSYYCKSDAGAKGLRYWKALENYIHYTEMALMEESMVMLGFSPRQVNACLEYLNRSEGKGWELRQDTMPLEVSKTLWNGYDEDPEDFYKKTTERVENLSKSEFRELLGDMGFKLEQELLSAQMQAAKAWEKRAAVPAMKKSASQTKRKA